MSMFSRPQAIWLVVALATASWAAVGCASTTPGQPAATSSPATSAADGATGTASPTSPGTPIGGASAPAQSGTAAPSSPASAPPSSAPASGPGLAACSTGSLLISMDDTQANGGAGSSYYPLNFTNTSATTCAMYGYPGVSFAAAATTAGQQIGSCRPHPGRVSY